MSLASDYATAEAGVQATVPAPWNGQRLMASVTEDGQCLLVLDGYQRVTVPGQLLLAFASWATTTFG